MNFKYEVILALDANVARYSNLELLTKFSQKKLFCYMPTNSEKREALEAFSFHLIFGN